MTNRPCFIFVNPNSSEVKQIKISLSKFFFGILFTFIILGILVKISIDLGVKFNQNSLISQLENENSILQQQVRQMDNQIKTIRLYMNQIEDLTDLLKKSEKNK